MYKQKGLTMVSWMVVLSFVGIVAVSALNIIPSYLSFFSARSILNGLQTDSAIRGKTPKDVRRLIIKRFGINNLHKIDLKKSLTFKSQGVSGNGAFTVIMHYEDRGKIIGNLYFVTVFDHEVELVP